MNTIVKIQWDKPEEQNWLCPDNIKLALSSYCKNTNFEVSELSEMSGSEAIYGFCGWLTTRKDKTVMSTNHDCACIAELIKDFCEVNKLSDPREQWTDNLIRPS